MNDLGRIANDWWDSYFLRDWISHRAPANSAFYAAWRTQGNSLPFADHLAKLAPATHPVHFPWQMISLGVEIRQGICKAMGMPWNGMDFPFLPYRHFQPAELPAYITPHWPTTDKCDNAHIDIQEYRRWCTWATGRELGTIVYGEMLKNYIRNCTICVNCMVGQKFPDHFALLGIQFRPATPQDSMGPYELLLIPNDGPMPNYPIGQVVILTAGDFQSPPAALALVH